MNEQERAQLAMRALDAGAIASLVAIGVSWYVGHKNGHPYIGLALGFFIIGPTVGTSAAALLGAPALAAMPNRGTANGGQIMVTPSTTTASINANA